jgi:hypothetical protein
MPDGGIWRFPVNSESPIELFPVARERDEAHLEIDRNRRRMARKNEVRASRRTLTR